MTLSSMTGFGSAEGAADGRRWRWDLRSVNGRGLDLRFRLGQGWERLEPELKREAQARLTRGSVTANLSLERDSTASSVAVNEAALMTVLEAALALSSRANLPAPTPEGLLSLRGVLEAETAEPADDDAIEAGLRESFTAALDALVAARESEGERLAAVVGEQLDRIAELAGQAAASPARAPEAIRARLASQVETLLEGAPSLDPQRLHQEAALLATKADIQEEVDRLSAHVTAARELIASPEGAVGRRLDFLAQEFGREANTLCAKSNDVALTSIGLELKVVVDQFREQVQNIA